jgi:hypothetical protein
MEDSAPPPSYESINATTGSPALNGHESSASMVVKLPDSSTLKKIDVLAMKASQSNKTVGRTLFPSSDASTAGSTAIHTAQTIIEYSKCSETFGDIEQPGEEHSADIMMSSKLDETQQSTKVRNGLW